MPEIPERMQTKDRHRDDVFLSQELLFRRFHMHHFQDNELEIDAIEMPDMSVMREKYCDDPCWVLIDLEDQIDFSGWGIAGFPRSAIPATLYFRGNPNFTFEPKHVPYKRNYPHTEIWAYDEGIRVTGKNSLPPEVHLPFRERLLWETVIVRPPQSTKI